MRSMHWHKWCDGVVLVIGNWSGKLALAISLQRRIAVSSLERRMDGNG